jgi:hypothetical protein
MTQSMQALEAADRVRLVRATVRRHIYGSDRDYRASRHRLAELLAQPIAPELEQMHAIALLRWGYNLPHPVAEKMLHAAGASTVIHVGQLTRRQRRLLTVLLDGGPRELADAEQAAQLDTGAGA